MKIIKEWVPGTPLVLSGLKLKKLPNIPRGVEVLDCSYNSIKYIHSLPRSIRELNCQGNMMECIENIPKNIVRINMSFNCIDELNLSKCKKLKYINLSWNNFTQVPKIPKSLEYLNICYNNICSLDLFDCNLTELDAYNCSIKMIYRLPDTLKTLNCEFNNLITIPFLPDNIETMNCSHNKLFYIPPLPSKLRFLDCSDNCIFVIPALPPTLQYFYCSNNNLYEIPMLPYRLEDFSYINNPLMYQPIFQEDVNPDSLNINEFMVLKNYIVEKEVDVIPETDLGNAFDFITLEDVNINSFLDQDKYNIIILSGSVKYACNRGDIINYLNKHKSEYVRFPWGQSIYYINGLELTKLDYLLYKIESTGRVIPDTVLHYLKACKISELAIKG